MFKRFSLGFAAGYLVGARGGEKHYEQFKRLGRQLQELPTVKQFLDEGGNALHSGSQRALEALKAKVDQLGPEEDAGDENPADDDRSKRSQKRSSARNRDDTDQGASDESASGSNEGGDSRRSRGNTNDDDDDDTRGDEHSGGGASGRSLATSIAHAAHNVYARGKVA